MIDDLLNKDGKWLEHLSTENKTPTAWGETVMGALNRHVVREFNPNRKDHRWGKRKLARDR
jgi:hypothetical protein